MLSMFHCFCRCSAQRSCCCAEHCKQQHCTAASTAPLFPCQVIPDHLAQATSSFPMSQMTGPMGAGDLLSSFLGSVILSMGFRIYDERETMKRHAPEILGATFLSSAFNMFSTAFLAKALGLQAREWGLLT